MSPQGGGLLGRFRRPERLLPLACVASAAVLFGSELMTAFEFTPPGGEALDSDSAGDRHGYALALLAGFAIGAVVVALLWGSKPAAIGVGVAGAIALLIFLVVDVPDAGKVGTLDDPRQSFFNAEAVPQEGFWLEMVGAVCLAISGLALATLTPEQLAGLRPAWLERLASRRRGETDGPKPVERGELEAEGGTSSSSNEGPARGPDASGGEHTTPPAAARRGPR